MALQPERIESTDFSVSRKGYDKDQVRLFLQQVAGEIRTMQADSAAAIDQARAEAEVVPEPPAQPSSTNADQFGALGDRIAVLLREAHDASEVTREQAHEEATALQAEAQEHLEAARSEAQQIRDDAAAYRVEVDEEAVEIRKQAEIDGNARLDERRTMIEEQEAAVAVERETAMQELSDARSQVAVLLQEARAQSEFIKQEAEEIIRTKVRANMEQAQLRIDLLRTTEASSKDRILTAQRELESALTRLDSEPLPEFPVDTEDLVLSEAEQRALDSNPGVIGHDEYATGESASYSDEFVISEEAAAVANDGAVETPFVDVQEVGEVVEANEFEVSDQEPVEEHEAYAESPADESAASETAAEDPQVEAAYAEDSSAGEVPSGDISAPMPPTAPSIGGMFDVEPTEDTGHVTDAEMPAALVSDDVIADPVSSDEAEAAVEAEAGLGQIDPPNAPIPAPVVAEHAAMGNTFSDSDFADAPLADVDTPENEDALARLVREAMQRAVESARGSEV